MTITSYKTILVPTDGSDYSYYAAEHAVYLAKSLGSKIYILNIVDTGLAFHAGIHMSESKIQMESSAKEAVDKIKALCDANGVVSEEAVVKGKPANAIVEFATKIGADCIVIGSIGVSAIEEVFVGSVSKSVLKNAKCPVLMVRRA
ncbi:MAG TPA: universal stress protein [Methanocellaceae archaeon]